MNAGLLAQARQTLHPTSPGLQRLLGRAGQRHAGQQLRPGGQGGDALGLAPGRGATVQTIGLGSGWVAPHRVRSLKKQPCRWQRSRETAGSAVTPAPAPTLKALHLVEVVTLATSSNAQGFAPGRGVATAGPVNGTPGTDSGQAVEVVTLATSITKRGRGLVPREKPFALKFGTVRSHPSKFKAGRVWVGQECK